MAGLTLTLTPKQKVLSAYPDAVRIVVDGRHVIRTDRRDDDLAEASTARGAWRGAAGNVRVVDLYRPVLAGGGAHG